MVDLIKNPRARTLLSILCVAGEYPCGSLNLIGPRRRIDKSVTNLTKPQKIFFSLPPQHPAPSPDAPSSKNKGESISKDAVKSPRECDSINGTLLRRRGSMQTGTVRFTHDGIVMMRAISPEESKYFEESHFYTNAGYSNDAAHIDRNHRVAEVTAMMARADIEFRPGFIQRVGPEKEKFAKPYYYPGKLLKSEAYGCVDTSVRSRETGLLFTPSNVYVTFNTRNRMLKWYGENEKKARNALAGVAGLNLAVEVLREAILVGSRDKVLPWLELMCENRYVNNAMNNLYPETHYCTMDTEGEALLRIISRENWRKRMLDYVFGSEEHSDEDGIDGYRYNKPVVCVADCDICRIAKLKYDPPTDGEYIILCSEGMKEPISAFIDSDKAEIRTISLIDIANKFPENRSEAMDVDARKGDAANVR